MSIEKKITITIDAKNAQRQLKAMNKLIKDNAKESKKAADESIASSKKEEAAFEKQVSKRLSSHKKLQKAMKAEAKEQQSINDRATRDEEKLARSYNKKAKDRLASHNNLQRKLEAGLKKEKSINNEAARSYKQEIKDRMSSHKSLQRQLKAGAKEQQSINDRSARNERRDASEFKSSLKERLSTHNKLQKAIIKGAKEKVAADNKAIVSSNKRAAAARKLGLAEIAAYKEANRRANPKTSAPSGVGRAVGAVSLAVTARQLVNLVDGYAEFTNRLRTATKSEQELLDVQKQIVDIAKETRTGLEENGLLYLRLAKATENAGTSSEDLLRITETVNKAVQIGGSSAQEAAGAIRQFTQIISAGFSSGFSQEINSLAEQTPGLFDVIVDGLRETSQEFRDLEDSGMSGIKILKEFSEKGIGDLDTLLTAVGSQTSNVNKEFLAIRPTITKSINVFRTSLQAYVGSADQATGSSAKLADGIIFLADNIHLLARGAMIVGGIVSGLLVRSMLASAVAMNVARVAAIGFWASAVPVAGVIAGVIGAVIGAIAAFNSVEAPVANAADRMSDFAKATAAANGRLHELSQLELIRSLKSIATEIESINEELSLVGVADQDTKIYSLRYTEALAAAEEYKIHLDEIMSRAAPGDDSPRGMKFTKAKYEEQLAIAKRYGALTLAFSEGQTEKALALLEELKKAEATQARLKGEEYNRTETGAEMAANAAIAAAEVKNSKLLTIQAKYAAKISEIEKQISLASEGAYQERGAALLKVIKANRDAEIEALKPDEEDNSSDIKSFRDMLLTKRQLAQQDFKDQRAEAIRILPDLAEANNVIIELQAELNTKLDAIRKEEADKAFEDNQKANAVGISALRQYNDLRLLAIEDAKEKEAKALISGTSRIEVLKTSFMAEKELNIARASEDVAIVSKYVENAEERRTLIVAIEQALTNDLNKIRDEVAKKEYDRHMAAANLASQAAAGVMGLIGTMSSLKQEAIDKELSSNKVFTEEQRKNKEMQAEKAFDSNQAMIKATIAMQTSLAVIGALAEPGIPFWVKAANVAIAASTGIASYAKANAQSYSAPNAPSNATPSSASSSSSSDSNVSNNTSSTTININAGNSSPAAIASALQSYINDNDGIIINPDSSQGRLLNA